MSAESAFEIFGIPGIIIFCLGALGYKIYQHYDIKFASIQNHERQATYFPMIDKMLS